MIVVLFEYVLMASTAAILITQVIVPLWYGMPIFPYFRYRGLQVGRVSVAREDVRNAQDEALLAQLKQEAKSYRTRSNGAPNEEKK